MLGEIVWNLFVLFVGGLFGLVVSALCSIGKFDEMDCDCQRSHAAACHWQQQAEDWQQRAERWQRIAESSRLTGEKWKVMYQDAQTVIAQWENEDAEIERMLREAGA